MQADYADAGISQWRFWGAWHRSSPQNRLREREAEAYAVSPITLL